MKEELKAAYDLAHLREEWLRIRNVRLIRESGSMTVFADRQADSVSAEAQTVWEQAIAAQLAGYAVSFVYNDVEPAPVVARPAAVKKSEQVEVDLPTNGVLLGGALSEDETTPVCDVTEDGNAVTLLGRLVACELRDDWSMRQKHPNCRVQFNLTDFPDSS